MHLLLITFVMQVVLAQRPSPYSSKYVYEEEDDKPDQYVRDTMAKALELLNRVQFPNELDIWSILTENWSPKTKTKNIVEFEYTDKTYILKPSRDILSVRFLEMEGTPPTVTRITLNGNIVYNALSNGVTTESPEYAEPVTHQVNPVVSAPPSDEEFLSGIENLSKRRFNNLQVPAFGKEKCGVVKSQGTPLITYGDSTSAGEWPWHAALYLYQGIAQNYICGGSLISRKHVLTAAHCVTEHRTNVKLNRKHLFVYLGKYNLYKQDGHEQNRAISQITVHPDYKGKHLTDDIAILELDEAAKITNFVRYVCLWEEDTSVVDRLGTIVGWGIDQTGHVSESLMQAMMPVIPTEYCTFFNFEYFKHFSSENIFCASIVHGTSACKGDSGGGMVFAAIGPDQTLIWKLRGVISAKVSRNGEQLSCEASKFIVLTDIVNYLGWIKSIIQ